MEDSDPGKVRRVLFCTGKIYYELAERRQKENRDDIALVRLEQLYPLRTDILKEVLENFDQAEKFAWVQEEPANMGAWSFLRSRIAELIREDPAYVGRKESAAPAVGSHRLHQEEQKQLLDEAFSL